MTRPLSALVLVLPLACGDDSGGAGTTSLGASSGAATSAATSVADTSTSAPSSSSGAGDTTAAAATSTGAGSSGSSSTGDSPVTYAAVAIIGGLDRVRITKADHDADVCTLLSLVGPEIASPLTITTPEGWSVEFASISTGASTCGGQEPPAGVLATAGTGMVSFGELGVTFPCSVDVDVQLEFPADMQVPTSDAMSAVGIAVDGC